MTTSSSRASRRQAAFALCLVGLINGCVPYETTQEREVAATSEELTHLAVERLIPVRVVHVLETAGAPDNADHATILQTIEEANEVYRAAGIQFYVSRVERFVMPTFSFFDDANLHRWDAVRDQLKLAFPSLNLATWAINDTKSEWTWMQRADAVWGPSNELTYWVHKDVHGSGGQQIHIGIPPNMPGGGGRAAVHIIGTIVAGPMPRYIFAHEAGHALGLQHTFDGMPGWTDPKTLAARVGADVWDLMYTPGAPNVFYNSRAQAAAAAALGKVLDRIDTNGNCSSDASNAVSCTVSNAFGSTFYPAGSAALKGLGFSFKGTGRGSNVMSYLANNGFRGLSDAQVELLQRQLRYEAPLPPTAVAAIAPPAGVSLNSDRPNLGGISTHRSGAYPLDFDGDGKRELAVWNPPTGAGTGSFEIARSSNSFSLAGRWIVSFGKLGDVPMPSDYNGDGCTDIGVWRTSGPNGTDVTNGDGHFVYCPSTKTAGACNIPSCASPATAQFGLRSDVPLLSPNFVTGAGGEIAVFRPSSGTFFWRSFVAGGANGGFPTPTVSKTFGGARFGSIPLVGDYDDDGKSDPTIYNPDSATFEILRSNAAYAQWTRTFPAELIPTNTTNPAAPPSEANRSGAIPLESVGILLFSRPAVYDPHNGKWHIMWDVATPGAVSSCTFGSQDAFPVSPAAIDRDNDWRTDMVTFTAPTFGGSGTLAFKNSSNGTCSGTTSSVASTGWDRPRMRVYATQDLTGDAKGDVVVFDPDLVEFQVSASELGYSTSFIKGFGTQAAVPL